MYPPKLDRNCSETKNSNLQLNLKFLTFTFLIVNENRNQFFYIYKLNRKTPPFIKNMLFLINKVNFFN